MQLGMIGLRRMGARMARRPMKKDHECVAAGDSRVPAVSDLEDDGALRATSLRELVAKRAAPRAIWMMVPADVDVIAAALLEDPQLEGSGGRVPDSGEGQECAVPK